LFILLFKKLSSSNPPQSPFSQRGKFPSWAKRAGLEFPFSKEGG